MRHRHWQPGIVFLRGLAVTLLASILSIAVPAPVKAEKPPPLQALAQAVTTVRVVEMPLTTFNGYAQIVSIPAQPTSQGAVYGIGQTVDEIRRGIIVRRMTDPERVDIIVYSIRGDTMHLYHTGPDGLLQTAVQRTRSGTNTTVSGKEVDTAFKGEIQLWLDWEKEYLKQQAEKARSEGPKKK